MFDQLSAEILEYLFSSNLRFHTLVPLGYENLRSGSGQRKVNFPSRKSVCPTFPILLCVMKKTILGRILSFARTLSDILLLKFTLFEVILEKTSF
jgi:hypothetical protein